MPRFLYNFAKCIIFVMCLITQLFGQFDRPDIDQMPSFTVGPLNLALSGRPNQTISSKITLITRNFDSPETFIIEKMELGQTNGYKSIPVGKGDGSRPCIDWINITNEIEANPDDRIDIPFTIRVPNDAKGSYFAYINVTTKPEQPEGEFVVMVRYRLPVSIELTIPGPAQMRLNTTDLIYKQGGYQNPATIRLHIKNEGFWKTRFEGDILIRDIASGQQTVVPIPYASSGNPQVVYPGLEIPVECELPVLLEPGNYAADVRLLMNKFGRTQSHFEFSVGQTSQVTADPKSKEEFDIDLHVSPDLIELPMRPGAVRNIPIIIRNNDKRDIAISASLHRARMQPSGSFVLSDEQDNEALTWIELETTEMQIEPNRAQSIKVKISVPDNYNEAFKDAYALRVSSVPINNNSKSEWDSRGESIIPIVAYDAIAKQVNLETEQFELIRPNPGLNPTACILRVKNTSQKAGRLRGKIEFADLQGKEIGHLDIGILNTELILPEGEREFRAMVPTLHEGEFKVIAELDVAGRTKNEFYEELTFKAIGVNP